MLKLAKSIYIFNCKNPFLWKRAYDSPYSPATHEKYNAFLHN